MTARDSRKRKRRATRRLEAWRKHAPTRRWVKELTTFYGETRDTVDALAYAFRRLAGPLLKVKRAPMKCRTMEPIE